MRVAVIDIGSNTLRLLIAQVSQDGKIKRLKTRRVVTRLGKGLIHTNCLNPTAKEKSLLALSSFVETCRRYTVSDIYAVATSAVREARDGLDFVEDIQSRLPIKVEILSETGESALTLRGVELIGGLTYPLLIIDVGGGSTEWIITDGKRPTIKSLPIGAIKLKETFLRSDPPTPDEIKLAANAIQEALGIENTEALSSASPTQVVLTGGTGVSLAMVDLACTRYSHRAVHRHRIEARRFYELFETLKGLTFEGLRHVKGLDSKRAPIVIAGMLIVKTLLGLTKKVADLMISDYSMLEGYLITVNARSKKGK